MKRFIKIIIFLCIFGVLFNLVCSQVWLNPTALTYFYREPKNSIDVAYLGSSNAYVHFNTTLAYNSYGFTTALLSNDSQSFSLIKNLIIEVMKRQNPSVYVIDMSLAYRDFTEFNPEDIRNTTDSMRFSMNRIDAINTGLKYLKKVPKKDYINYYFSFLLYHNRYTSIGRRNPYVNEALYKGYRFEEILSPRIQPFEKQEWSKDSVELSSDNKEVIIDLLDFIKENNLNVIFVISPRIYKGNNLLRLNDATKLIEEKRIFSS